MEDFCQKIQAGIKNRNFLYTVIFLFLLFFVYLFGIKLVQAASAPTIITYQGKLLVNGSVATTTQSMKFVIYDSSSGGTALYTASGTLPTTSTISVSVSSGFFTVNLGDTGTNSLDPTIFKNNSAVYLEVTIGGETLSPRKRVTAAPYAFNAKYLDGVSATATPQSSAYIPISDSSGNFNFNNITSTNLYVSGTSTLTTSTVSGLLSVTGNSSLGTITAGTWNGTAISNVYGGTGQNSSAWSGFVKVTAGTWSTSTISVNDISNSSTLALLAGNQTFTGLNTFSVTTTFDSTTIGGTLSVTGNSSLGNITAGTWNGTAISNVYGGTGQNSSAWSGFVKVTGGTWATSTISTNDLSNSSTIAFLAGNQTFTGNNIFSVTSTFATATFSGRVGIGTTTPEENLHIYNGNLRIDSPVNPTLVGSYNTTGITYNIKVSGKYAYVADGASGLEIFDITTPFNPALISTYDTAGTAYDVEVVGRYAYVADDTSGLLVIDLEDAGNPRLIGSYNTPGNAVALSVVGKYAYVADQTGGVLIIDISNPYSPSLISTISATSGDDVYVRGKYAYIADYGGGFKIVDISNPLSPALATSTGSGLANSVHVIGRYAYVSFNTSTSNNIVAYNIANPISISQTDTFSTTNAAQGVFWSGNYLYAVDTTTFYIFSGGTNSILGSYSLNDVKALTIVGKYAYISNGTSGFTILDIKGADLTAANVGSVSTNNLTVWENIDVGNNISVRAGLNVGLGGILSNGPLALNFSSQPTTSLFSVSASSSQIINILGDGNIGVGTSTPQQKLHLFDGTLLVDNPVNFSLSGSLAISSPRSVYVSGKYAYIMGTDGLSIANIENKNSPSLISSLSLSGIGTAFDRAIFVAGKYAYITASDSSTLYVIDVSNPKSPTTTGSVTNNSSLNGAKALYVSGNYVYVAANNTSTVAIVDIANPTSPMVVGSVRDTTKLSSVSAVYVSGRYAYATGYDNNYFVVIDVIDPNSPTIVGSFTNATMGGPRSVYVSGNYAYVASTIMDSLVVVDITDPTNPVLTGSLIDNTNLDGATSIFVSGKYAYLAAANNNRFSIVDISNTSTLRVIGTYSSTPNINTIWSVFVSGKYVYAISTASNNLTIFNIQGADIHAANIGNITSNDLTVWENSDIGNNLFVRNAINVGVGGIQSNGNFSINSNISSGNLFQIVSSTNSSIFMISAGGSVGINTTTFGFGDTFSYKLKIDAGGTNSGAIGANGFIRATAYITPSTTLDLAETYPINTSCAQNGTCPADGDIVCIDASVVAGVKKCSASDSDYIVGIVSTNPGFLLGGGEFLNPTQNLGTVKVALAGRVPVKVSTVNGSISPGDKLTVSNQAGVAAKAIGEVPIVGVAMEAYSGIAEGNVVAFVNLGWQNQLYKALTLDTNSSTLTVGSGISPYNFSLSGDFTMSNIVLNRLAFNAKVLFESNTNDTNAFVFNAKNFGISSDKYLLSLRSNNESRFSVSASGDVRANGNIYAAGAVFGTSTNPGDLAERVDIASDEVVEPGDVMVVDFNSPDTYRRSSQSNEQAVAGVISTNPSIVVGNGQTNYTAVMAMVGRVPIKVSAENGIIKKGDLLVSASEKGYAMRYDSTKDDGSKVIGIIGLALEDMSSSKNGKIMGLVRTGWVSNIFTSMTSVKQNLKQLATASGISLSDNSNLNVKNYSRSLVYNGGNLDLQGNHLLNVASIVSKNNRWEIDEQGRFITRIKTSSGDKELYSIQSPDLEFVFSSSSQLIAGEIKVEFENYVQEIIDQSWPIKINVTLTSADSKGVYVSEKNAQGFVVKEIGNGTGNATFDWVVVAKRKSNINATENNQETIINSTSNGNTVVQSEGVNAVSPIVDGSTSSSVKDNATTTISNIEKNNNQTMSSVSSSPDIPLVPVSVDRSALNAVLNSVLNNGNNETADQTPPQQSSSQIVIDSSPVEKPATNSDTSATQSSVGSDIPNETPLAPSTP